MPISSKEYIRLLKRAIISASSLKRDIVEILHSIYDEHMIPFKIYVDDNKKEIRIEVKKGNTVYFTTIKNPDVYHDYLLSYIQWSKKEKEK